MGFECKIQDRLRSLKEFECSEDRRVSSLVQRAAQNVEHAFEMQFQALEEAVGPLPGTRSEKDAVECFESPSESTDNTDKKLLKRGEPQLIGHGAVVEVNPMSGDDTAECSTVASTSSATRGADMESAGSGICAMLRRYLCCKGAPAQASADEKIGLSVIEA